MNARLLLLLALALAGLGACVTPRKDPAPATPQRPLVSVDTNTTAFGTFELEGGATIDPKDYHEVPFLLKYGAGPATEVSIGWSPFVHVELPGEDEDGAGDVRVGIRHRMWDELDGSPAIGVMAEVKLPTADNERSLGTGEVDAYFGAIAYRTVGDIAYTGFYRVDVLGQAADDTDIGHTLALAAAAPIIDEFRAFAELSGTYLPETDDDTAQAILGGGYDLSPSITFDAGVSIGLTDDTPDFQILFGFTTNFGLWMPERQTAR